MSFRNNVEALTARRDALRQRRQRHPHDPRWQTEWAQLRVEIDATRTELAQALLDRTRIAKRCDADWEAMGGGEHVRQCAHCDKRVYHLSGLTAVEAAALLTGADGELCVRLYRRPDGTVMTSDCHEGSKQRWRRSLRVLGAAAGVAACIAGAQALGQEVQRSVTEIQTTRARAAYPMGEAPYDPDEEIEPGYTAAEVETDLEALRHLEVRHM